MSSWGTTKKRTNVPQEKEELTLTARTKIWPTGTRRSGTRNIKTIVYWRRLRCRYESPANALFFFLFTAIGWDQRHVSSPSFVQPISKTRLAGRRLWSAVAIIWDKSRKAKEMLVFMSRFPSCLIGIAIWEIRLGITIGTDISFMREPFQSISWRSITGSLLSLTAASWKRTVG